MTSRDPDAPPDPRRLAALLDGRLDDDARRQLLGELAASDEGLDVYADAAAVLAELEREGVGVGDAVGTLQGAGPSHVRTRPPQTRAARRWHRRVWTLGPVVVAASVSAIVVMRGWLPELLKPTPDASGVVAAVAEVPSGGALLAARFGAGWADVPWSAARGASDAMPAHVRAFRLGVRSTDLAVAIGARDTAAASAAAGAIRDLASGAETGGLAAERAALLGRRSGAPEAGQELARLVQDLEDLAGRREAFEFGRWAESARLAGRAGDLAFFAADGRAIRVLGGILAAIDRLPAERRGELAPATARLRALAAHGAANPTDLAQARAALDAVMSDFGP